MAADVPPLAQTHRLGSPLPHRHRLSRLRLLPPPRRLARAVTQQAQSPEQEAGLLLHHGEGQSAPHVANVADGLEVLGNV